jgi:hypothetical protein
LLHELAQQCLVGWLIDLNLLLRQTDGQFRRVGTQFRARRLGGGSYLLLRPSHHLALLFFGGREQARLFPRGLLLGLGAKTGDLLVKGGEAGLDVAHAPGSFFTGALGFFHLAADGRGALPHATCDVLFAHHQPDGRRDHSEVQYHAHPVGRRQADSQRVRNPLDRARLLELGVRVFGGGFRGSLVKLLARFLVLVCAVHGVLLRRLLGLLRRLVLLRANH